MAERRIKVFLEWAGEDGMNRRNTLMNILERADMEVVTKDDLPAADLDSKTTSLLGECDCSVHILSERYERLDSSPLSISEVQFDSALSRLQSDPNFKMFIWYPPEVINASKEQEQEAFISKVKNAISLNMVFTAVDSPIQFVDDIRSMTEVEEQETFDIDEADVFVIFNELDLDVAEEVVDMLSDIVDVTKLNIVLDSDTDYSEYAAQQMDKSKLAVVYFKDTADWALPFAQQIWKKTGGASSHTPILLIGDRDPDTNLGKEFEAPKVISLIVAGDLIPLEIKVQYDKLTEGS
jgi:hypothetical protein